MLMHFGSAYTNGDTIVYFPNLKAAAVGKVLTSSPIPDYAQDGRLLAWVPLLDEFNAGLRHRSTGKWLTGYKNGVAGFQGQAGATG